MEKGTRVRAFYSKNETDLPDPTSLKALLLDNSISRVEVKVNKDSLKVVYQNVKSCGKPYKTVEMPTLQAEYNEQ